MKRTTLKELDDLLPVSSYERFFEKSAVISDLFGKTLTEITLPNEDERQEYILFECADGSAYLMYHEQDCCERVTIEDISGNLDCLIGNPLTKAESVSDSGENEWGTYTYTFYHLGTVKGYVDVRWYGESNGYYSESVDMVRIR